MSRLTKAFSLITAGVLSLSVILPCYATYERDITTDPLFVYGDVNFDGKCNSHDIVRMMKHIAGTYDEYNMVYYADLNSDMIVNSKDLVRLMKLISEKVTAPEIANPFADFSDKNLMNYIPDTISGVPVSEEESARIISRANEELSEAVSVSLKLEFTLSESMQDEEMLWNGYMSLALNRDRNGDTEEAEIYVYISDPSDSSDNLLISIILRDGFLYITFTDSTSNYTLFVNKTYLDRVLSMGNQMESSELAEYFALSVYTFENTGYGAVYQADIEKISSAILQYIADNSNDSDFAAIFEKLFKLNGFEISAIISDEGGYIGGFSNGGYEINLDNDFIHDKIIISSLSKFVLNTSDEKVTFGPSYNVYDPFSLDLLMLNIELSALYDQNGDKVANYDELYAELCNVYGKNDVDDELYYIKLNILYFKIKALFDEEYHPVENYDELYSELCNEYGKDTVDEEIEFYKNSIFGERVEALFDEEYRPVENYDELYAELCGEYGKCAVDEEIEFYKYIYFYKRIEALFDEDGIPVSNYGELYASVCKDYDQEEVDSYIEYYRSSIIYNKVWQLFDDEGNRVENYAELYAAICEIYGQEEVDSHIEMHMWSIIYDKVWQLFDCEGNPVEDYDEIYFELCLKYGESTIDDFISNIENGCCW